MRRNSVDSAMLALRCLRCRSVDVLTVAVTLLVLVVSGMLYETYSLLLQIRSDINLP